jgi:hypothetical protein
MKCLVFVFIFLLSVSCEKEIVRPAEFDKYSTSEQDTGKKWIDGKSIYRCVYCFQASTILELLPEGNQRTVLFDEPIDSFVSVYGLHISDAIAFPNHRLEVIQFINYSANMFCYTLNSTFFSLSSDDTTYLSQTIPCRVFMIFEYTKK